MNYIENVCDVWPHKSVIGNDTVDLVIVTNNNFLFMHYISRKCASDNIRSWYHRRMENHRLSGIKGLVRRAYRWFCKLTGKAGDEGKEVISYDPMIAVNVGSAKDETTYAQWAIGFDDIVAMYVREAPNQQQAVIDAYKEHLKRMEDKMNEGDEWKNKGEDD